MDPEAEEKLRRARNLLASYYGVSVEEDDTHQALDTNDFDVSEYLKKLTEHTRLMGLIGKHRELSSQIRTLDSSMQQLIYENYNKFITATDEIKSMKSNMESMDQKMGQLMDTIGAVVQKSNAVQGRLQPKRDQMEELNRVRFLVRRLQGVFELPQKLRICLDNDALEIATRHYQSAIPFLQKYGGTSAFSAIKADCDSLVKDITYRLYRKIRENPDDVSDVLRMLRALGEDVNMLTDLFAQCQRQRLAGVLGAAKDITGILTKAHRAGITAAADLDNTSEVTKLSAWGLIDASESSRAVLGGFPTLVIQMDQRIITLLSQTAAIWHDVFGDDGDGSKVPVQRNMLSELAREALVAHADLVVAASEVTHPPPATAVLAALRGATDAEGVAASLPWGTDEVLRGLSTFAADISRLEHSFPRVDIHAIRDLAIVRAARGHVKAAVQLPADLCAAEVQKLCEGKSDAVDTAARFGRAMSLLAGGAEGAVVSCRKLVENRPVANLRIYVAPAVHVAARDMFQALSSLFRRIAVDESTASALRLVMARLCQESSAAVVPRVAAALSQHFPMGGVVAGGGRLDEDEAPGAASHDSDPLAMKAAPFDPTAAAAPLRACVETLLRLYVENEGRSLALAVRKSLQDVDWMAVGDPSGPRAVCQEIRRGVDEIESEFGNSGAGRRTGLARKSGAVVPPSSKDPTYPGTGEGLELGPSALLTGVLRVALKAWVEGLRGSVLGRGAYRQMQVDVLFVRHLLARHMAGGGATAKGLRFLLSEVLRAAAQRTVDAQGLTAADISTILDVEEEEIQAGLEELTPAAPAAAAAPALAASAAPSASGSVPLFPPAPAAAAPAVAAPPPAPVPSAGPISMFPPTAAASLAPPAPAPAPPPAPAPAALPEPVVAPAPAPPPAPVPSAADPFGDPFAIAGDPFASSSGLGRPVALPPPTDDDSLL